MSQDAMVIIGTGHAGARAAQSLRASGWEGRIIAVDREKRVPYERPPLSKAVLSGTAEPEAAALFPSGFLRDNKIDYQCGIWAKAIDRHQQQVQFSNGDSVGYTRLLLATGATPRLLDVPGKELSGSYYLRKALDAEQLSQRLNRGAKIVIVGGGLIGLEAAASAIQRGCDVTVIEAGPRLMTRASPPELADRIRLYHEAQGVTFLIGNQVTAFLGEGWVERVQLDDGTMLPCDTILISIGIIPRVELATASGLAIDNGIAVNRYLQSSDPNIFSAGDASAFEQAAGPRIRMENWKNAEDQGTLAGRNMAGAEEPYMVSPWMWSDQYDQTMQIAGYPEQGLQHIQRHCGDGSLLIYHLGKGNTVAGVSGFGSLREVARGVRTGQMLMQKNVRLDTEIIQNPQSDLKAAARPATA